MDTTTTTNNSDLEAALSNLREMLDGVTGSSENSETPVDSSTSSDVENFVEETIEAAVEEPDEQPVEQITEEEASTEVTEEISPTNRDIIPENSKTIEIQESTSRFSSAVWFNKVQEQTITLAGIGGIGSWTAVLLARMQPRFMYLYDPDTVEVGNMSGQLYEGSHIGRHKVYALADILARVGGYYGVYSFNRRFDEVCQPTEIMICGFDNMLARKSYYRSWKRLLNSRPEEERDSFLFIDARLAAEEFQVFCITGNDTFSMAKYESEWLFTDEEADETVCSYKQTSYMSNMVASVIVNLFTNFCANLCDPVFPRDLPFFTSYDGSLMYFKTEV